nr:hypothetical protein [Tanacetum cinerariifolium]
MGNVFCGHVHINRRFDLKGSSHGRIMDIPETEIDANTTLKDLDLIFIFLMQKYCQKTSTWNRLLRLMGGSNGAWCLFGDLNLVRRSDDRLNSQVCIKEMDEFNDFINNAKLIEVAMCGRKFTRISDDGLKFSQLDRFLMNEEFNCLWGNLSVVALDRKLSDHCPIVLKDMDLDFGPKPFRTFDIWLEESDIGIVVETAWNLEMRSNRPDCRFRDKLKNVKMALKKWSKDRFGATKERIETCKKEAMRWELEVENRILNENERAVWLEARKQWLSKENEFGNMLRQKARVKWDAEGDENSNFFHSFIKRKNNKGNIRELKKYRPMMQNCWSEFKEGESWDAIRGCGSDKAPGPDGFNFKFIKKFWEVIKADLVKAVNWFADKREITKGCNSSFVTIIPKVADPIGLWDFRPISLIGCYYKIIAKLMAERVKKVVGQVVGDVQNAFIKGRYILDGLLIANETVDYLKKSNEKGIIFKVDFDKAYDSINWRFLVDIMKKMRFGQKWCNWVERCCRSASMSILVNGFLTEEFSLARKGFKARWMGCGVGDLPFTYLGLPIGENMRQAGAWNNVVGKVKNRGRWKWTLNDDGVFMVKELTKMIEEKILRVENGGQVTLWNKLVPKKVNIFIWRALKGRLPVREELDKRGIDLDSLLCPCCDTVVESCNHSLVLCKLALSLWERIYRWWKIRNINAFFIDEVLSSNGNVNMPSHSSSIWQVVIWTAGYYIWKERNPRCVWFCCSAAVAFLFWVQSAYLDVLYYGVAELIVCVPDAYTYPPLPRVPLSYQASACSLSTWHFLKLKLLENSVEVSKILENKLQSMKILKNKLESLKLQENQSVDGLVPLFIKKIYIRKCLREAVKEIVENHREEEDQEGNNSSEIETLTYHVLATYSSTVAETKLGERAETEAVDSVAEGYKKWVHHGESDLPPPPLVIDNTRQPQMSDMIALLNDLSYIPLNNEQNEATQGDIGETSNEPTQAKCNEFEELYASANEELYPGCDYVTRLDFMAKFTYFKVKGKLTDSIFNKMLEFFQHVYPTTKGYKLPLSYYAITKTFKTIGLGYESIHAYVNDCFLFWGNNNKDVHFCLVCKTSIWEDSNTPGKKVPKKVLCYFSIIPRLQRLYKSSHTTKEMTWHATGKCTDPDKMQHPVDGRAWKNFDINQAYIMWLVILTTYNLPSWLCMKESSFMLTLLIHGPKSPGKDIDVYLRPLIDNLKVLWALKGVETIDVATCQKFNIRAMVLWTINDFLARSSLCGWSGQGYKACPTCNEDTPFVYVLGKTAYVGYTRFLKKPHKWKRSLEFNGEIENRDPPRKINRDQIQTQLARLPVKGKHPSYGGVKIKRNILVELNWTKRSIFYDLEYWLGIRNGLWLGQTKNGKCSEPQAAYSFTPENRKKFCQFIKGVKLPDGFGSNFKHTVTDNDTNITILKSHDCHIMMQRLLPYGLQQYFPDEVAKPIIELCSFFKQICSATLMEDDMFKAQSKVVDILCNLELIYPPAFFDIMIHLVIHLPLEALEDNDPGVSATDELFALACGPTPTLISVNSCVVNGVRFVVHSRDERRTTQNSGICSPGGKDGEMYYDGQSTDVDAPLDTLDLNEDGDISDDGDVIPHDLADSDDEDLVNVDDDDGVEVVYSNVSGCGTGHDGDDRPPTHHIPTGCGGCFANRGKGTQKPNLGGRKAGRLHARQETRNLGLKKITDDKGPVPIRFEWDDKKTMMPLSDHASHWSNYLGELIREMPLYYPSWQKVPAKRKAAILTKIGTQFDLKHHMQSQRWIDIDAGIQQHLQKLYNTIKASLKAAHWVINLENGTYNVESIRQRRLKNITLED